MLKMCCPVVRGWAAGSYFVLPPHPPPNERLGGPLRGAGTLSVPPPRPPRTGAVSILQILLILILATCIPRCVASARPLGSCGLPTPALATARLGLPCTGSARPSLRPLGPSAWLGIANIGSCCDVFHLTRMFPATVCDWPIKVFVGRHKTCWERGRVFRFVLSSEQDIETNHFIFVHF
jgi:hypothetical protein